MKRIKIKRVYEKAADEDGYRILVDRLWPRGLKKETAALNEWNKKLAPSPELRKWFGHKPEHFKRFAECYQVELAAHLAELERVYAIAEKENLTLLYAAKSEVVNHAIILLRTLKQLQR